jgi:hypothetical protein
MLEKRKMTAEEKRVCLYLLSNFFIEGVRADLVATEGQIIIFWAIVFRVHNRIHIETCTQYGKSLFIALGCIIVSCIDEKVVCVLAPSGEKAKIIMRYYFEHLGDNKLFEDLLDANTKLERLRQEESKDRIMLRNRGGMFCLSLNQRNFGKSVESAMGAGSEIVIGDEFGLVSDDTEATVYRMIAGKGKEACYIKVGNTFYSEQPYSHFYESSNNPKYLKIHIDYKQALAEGRYTEEFVEEARKKPMFDELYACIFPKTGGEDKEGYKRLFPDALLDKAFIKEIPEEKLGVRRLGTDVGEGNDGSVHTIRYDNVMFRKNKNGIKDIMQQVPIIEKCEADEVYVDHTGVGSGVTYRCLELGMNVRGIMWGSSSGGELALDTGTKKKSTRIMRFANLKAENYWKFMTWILEGGRIVEDKDGDFRHQLRQIKYKINSGGRVQIEPKERMKARGHGSPDTADSGALTFNKIIKPKMSFL